jgi:hypothetical protein
VRSENLYSIILDFRGGTYISQVTSSTPAGAIKVWASQIDELDARTWRLDVDRLKSLVLEDSLTAINGCKNIWCLSATLGAHLVLINVIQTATA